jgi:hypothetical protein
VSTALLSEAGFATRSIAQESFFRKAKLLYDFQMERDSLVTLQGSIILCAIILDHPTNFDFTYWFYNAVRLATKLNISGMYVSTCSIKSLICRRTKYSLE